MAIFQDEGTAERTRERLEELTGLPLGGFFDSVFAEVPSPDQALVNLERWLRTLPSPALHLEHLTRVPRLARLLMVLFGGSQPMADTLIQNPDLASLILEPTELQRHPTVEGLLKEGIALLASATSYSHALDRLRYLKQRWTLPIVVNDLAGTWSQEQVWRALSDLADALITLALERAWKESPASHSLGERCPVMVVAFGKLGGREVNYSSDVDLVYVAEDGLLESADRDLARFAESLGRALSDSMGRGFLYRIDLRLRPYGKSGALVPTMRATEAYYRLYAEPWEIQALLRSRPVAGPDALVERWRAVFEEQCFKPAVSEASLDPIVQMRARIEDHSDPDDLKRGHGGIRDVEFLVQTLQLLHGHSHPSLRVGSTCDVIRALDTAGVLHHSVALALIDGYTFLRKLEHRCQLVAHQQTHAIPSGQEAREHLARLMGDADWKALEHQLTFHRRTIGTLYQSIVNPANAHTPAREAVLQGLGPLGAAALQWFDPLPSSEAFYDILVENQDSLSRVRKLLDEAPALATAFRKSVSLTEMLLSGEIEEEDGFEERLEELPADVPLQQVATTFSHAHTRILAQWVFDPKTPVLTRLSGLCDRLIAHAMHRLYADFDVLALGSFGRQEIGWGSDLDAILLVKDPGRHQEAESQAQNLIALLSGLKRQGVPIELDLRLRPEGGQGLLVRTYDGLRAYELEGMEMWERFALGQARLVSGNPEARELVIKAAYALPLTPERLRDLIAMKKRIETERVNIKHQRRDVKLGYGGLADIEWFVHLHEMRYPTATKAGESVRLDDGIRRLGRAQLINALEMEALLEALEHLLAVRLRLGLLGYTKDVVPENPDKLDHLAQVCGYENGYAFLMRHEHVIDSVRSIYTEGLERLRA